MLDMSKYTKTDSMQNRTYVRTSKILFQNVFIINYQ